MHPYVTFHFNETAFNSKISIPFPSQNNFCSHRCSLLAELSSYLNNLPRLASLSSFKKHIWQYLGLHLLNMSRLPGSFYCLPFSFSMNSISHIFWVCVSLFFLIVGHFAIKYSSCYWHYLWTSHWANLVYLLESWKDYGSTLWNRWCHSTGANLLREYLMTKLEVAWEYTDMLSIITCWFCS